MANVPWEREESRNYICMQNIVTDVVSERLRSVFKREWNSRYQASFGGWDDTSASGVQLYNFENHRKRSNSNVYLSQFRHGDTNQWDCSVLFDAILYSKSIGSSLNSVTKTAVDKLRMVRNRIMHADKATLTDAEFQNMTSDVENSFIVLGFPVDDITSIKRKIYLYKSFQILPPKPTHEVVSRSEKINEIKQDLQELRDDNDGKLTYSYISGNPGSGKSQLARDLGKDLYESVDWRTNTAFVMTLNAKNLDSLLYSYEDFCRRLNCNEHVLESVMNSSKPKEEKIKDLRSQITTRIQNWKLWWIIVDNVEDLHIINPLLPQVGDEIWNNGQIIVTIQNTTSVPSNSLCSKHISLSDGMKKQECRQLLSSLSDTDADDPLLDEVAEKLDHQPLAMAAAAIYIRRLKEKEFSWRDYLEKLEKGKRRATEEELKKTNSAYSFTMSTAVFLAVQKAAENDFILNETFNLFALISFEPLPMDIIIKYIQQLNQSCEKEEIHLAIEQCSLFLFAENGNDVRLHRVVHDQAIELFSNRPGSEMKCSCQIEIVNERGKVYNVVKALYFFKDRDDKVKILPHLKSFHAINNKLNFQQDLLDSNGPGLKIHEIANMYIFFEQILNNNFQFKLALEFLNVSLQIWRNSDKYVLAVLDELGRTYYLLGEYSKSNDYYHRAMEIGIKKFGANHIKVAKSHNQLGIGYKAMGKLLLAKDHLQRAVEIYTNVLGPKHIYLATSYNNLGTVYQAMGELERAKGYQQTAMEIRKNVLGPSHIHVAASYNNLGAIHCSMGELEQAKDYHQRAIKNYIDVLGPNHIDVSTSCHNLGLVHYKMGELKQAKNYFQRAMEIRMKALGPNHINVATSYNNLGSLYHTKGELKQAKDYYQQAMEIGMKALGPNHIDVAMYYNSLGSVYHDMGELKQAKDYYQQAMEIGVKALGPNHIDVATYYNNLGSLYHTMGELKQAKDYYQQAMEVRMKALGPNHINVATSYNNLGSLYHDMGDLEQANDYYQQAMEIRMKALGPNHIHVAISYNSLGSVYHDMGELKQAKDYYQQAMEIRMKALGPNHINVATSYNSLGLVYQDMGELEQAKDCHQQAMEIRVKVLGPNNICACISYDNLGSVYHDMGELEQAKDYYQRALEIRIKALGPNHILVATCYDNLGSVYKAMGELEQSKDYHQRGMEIRMNVLGPNHIKVATSYNNLGSVYHDIGELEQAKDYHQRAMEIRIKFLGPNHMDVGTSYDNLGLVYKAMGELEQGQDYRQQGMEIRMNALGPSHFKVATSCNNLGLVYFSMGKLEQAKDYHQRAMEIRIKALGHDHIDVSTSCENLSTVYAAMGELERAEVYRQRAIESEMRH